MDDVIEIFGTFLNGLSVDYISSKMTQELLDGLNTNNDYVIELWLKQLDRVTSNDVGVENLMRCNTNSTSGPVMNDIISKIIDIMRRDNVTISKYATRIIKNISFRSYSLVFNDVIITKLTEMTQVNDIIKMRILSLMIEISLGSPSLLTTVNTFGFLKIITDSCLSSDPLVVLNSIQLFIDLASVPHGIQYLNTSGSLKKIADLITSGTDIPFADLLLPGYLSMFAAVAQSEPQLLDQEYKGVLLFIISIFRDSGSLVPTAIDVMSGIGSSVAGKRILSSLDGLDTFLKLLGSVIRGTNGELKIRALRCLSLLLKNDDAPDPDGQMSSLLESWYNLVNGDPDRHDVTSNLYQMIQQPFLDLRLGSYEVMKILVTHVWGQTHLKRMNGFTQYLLNRNSEFSKDGKEIKYQLICELVSSPFTMRIFGREEFLLFRKYMKEGPYFVETADPTVAVEGQ